ncbi:hypothetical protein QQP08_017890 [Theobroma cacao]|nr:hypothetical protein QQP08_017890 [Theobroma cacao]
MEDIGSKQIPRISRPKRTNTWESDNVSTTSQLRPPRVNCAKGQISHSVRRQNEQHAQSPPRHFQSSPPNCWKPKLHQTTSISSKPQTKPHLYTQLLLTFSDSKLLYILTTLLSF